MSRLDWTELCLKLFALFLLIQCLAHIPVLFSALVMNIDALGKSGAWFTISGQFVPFLAALTLWLSASSLSSRIWANATTPRDARPASIAEMQVVLFSTIGLYVLITAVPEFLRTVITYQQNKALIGAVLPPTVEAEHWGQALEMGLKVTLSMWLLLGSQGIVRLLQRARSI
jgi:hypothetical protein